MSRRKADDPKIVLAVIKDDEEFVGYFKDLSEVEKYMEKEFIEECRILEVHKVIDAAYPPEPELEFTDVDLTKVLNHG